MADASVKATMKFAKLIEEGKCYRMEEVKTIQIKAVKMKA